MWLAFLIAFLFALPTHAQTPALRSSITVGGMFFVPTPMDDECPYICITADDAVFAWGVGATVYPNDGNLGFGVDFISVSTVTGSEGDARISSREVRQREAFLSGLLVHRRPIAFGYAEIFGGPALMTKSRVTDRVVSCAFGRSGCAVGPFPARTVSQRTFAASVGANLWMGRGRLSFGPMFRLFMANRDVVEVLTPAAERPAVPEVLGPFSFSAGVVGRATF